MIGKETKTSDNDIAIVGISVKFPQIDTLDDFRKVLQEGVQCVSSCPEQRKGDIEDYLNYCNYDVSKRKYRQLDTLMKLINLIIDFLISHLKKQL